MVKCKAIQDLLPLYVDGVASEESCSLVEEHVLSCETCRSELEKMQNGEVRLYFKNDDAYKISVLKGLKKKIFKKMAIVAASVIAASILVFGGIVFIFEREIPLQYHNADFTIREIVDEFYAWTFTSMNEPPVLVKDEGTILEIVVPSRYFARMSSRVINIDGEPIRIMYFYLARTLATTFRTGTDSNQHMRLATSRDEVRDGFDGELINRIELYYLVRPIRQRNYVSNEEFLEQVRAGVLLWSGVLE